MYDSIKCVCVGDGAVGKTSLLVAYSENRFPEDYDPTVFDNYNANVVYQKKPLTDRKHGSSSIGDRVVSLHLWDTAGQEDYDRLRSLSYPDTEVFLLVFSLVSPTSFENVKSKWVPELQKFNPSTPIVLVGSKLDLRENVEVIRTLSRHGKAPITHDQGVQMAKVVGAAAYVECSARSHHNLKEVFEAVMDAHFLPILEGKDKQRSNISGRRRLSQHHKCVVQ